MSNKLFSGFCLIVMICLLIVPTQLVFGHANGMGTSDRTGAPGKSNCTSCHGGSPNTGGGYIRLTGLPSSYVANSTYALTVQVAQTGQSRWGFQIKSTKGLIAVTDSTHTYFSNTTLLNHNSAGSYAGQANSAQWNFNWTAPSATFSSITFYGAGLAADNSGDESGDFTYTLASASNLLAVPPVAGFYGSPISGTAPLQVNFVDTSANAPTTWGWDFGDGGSSSLQNPSHIYGVVSDPTSYNVQLIVTNSMGTSTALYPNYISVTPPVPPIAGFSGNPTSGISPLNVNFTDTSANSPTGWGWDFGDGGTSSIQNPSHLYASVSSPTSYTVQLIVNNAAGSSTAIQPNYISLTPPPPNAGFYANPLSGQGPLNVNFIDTSTNNPTSWDWDFGDGGTSNIQNPSHGYSALTTAVNYSVRLIVSNSYGTSTMIRSNYINVTENLTAPPVLKDVPHLKLFINQSLNPAFDLANFLNSGTATTYSIISNFLDLSVLNGSTISQSSYSTPTVGRNYYAAMNVIGTSTASNHVKYSSYKIQKLPKVGLNPNSSWDINIGNYTLSNGASLPPASFGNDNSLSSSDSSRINVSWLNSSVLRITAQASFTSGSPVNVDVIASPNSTPPYGVDIDKERIMVYPNLMPKSTFSTGQDTTTYGYEFAPGKSVMATVGWVSTASDSQGTQANGVMTLTFISSSSGIKGTAFASNRVNYQAGQWYTARMRVTGNIGNSHQSQLYNFSNPSLASHVDLSAYILFGTPSTWTWLEAPLYSNETGLGLPQLLFKAGSAGTLYIDEIQIINAAPTLVDSDRYPTRMRYPYGDFEQGADTTGWGQEIYPGAGTSAGISVSNGDLLVNFSGASSGTGQKGIKWTASNGVAGKAYTAPNTAGREVGIRATLTKESGNFNTLSAIILLGAFGVQTSGQQAIGVAPSDLMASAEYGRLTDGIHRTVGKSVNPYHLFQFGVKNNQAGVIRIDDADYDSDNDDPYYGDEALFPED